MNLFEIHSSHVDGWTNMATSERVCFTLYLYSDLFFLTDGIVVILGLLYLLFGSDVLLALSCPLV